MYEEAARVPLSMKFPHGSYKGTKISQTVSHVDFMPTLCEFLDIHPSNSMDGTSLMPLISGTCKESEDGTAFIQYDGNGALSNFQRCIVKGNYKLIVDFFKDETYYELYHLSEDRQETTNLMFDPEYDDRAKSLAAELARHMVETADHLDFPSFQPEKFRKIYGGI